MVIVANRSARSLVVLDKRRAELAVFENLDKGDLLELNRELEIGAPDAIEMSVRFFCAETRGNWHGRSRAMMARKFKHVSLSSDQAARVMDVILNRLASGNFAEQFRDELRLAIKLDPRRTFDQARISVLSKKAHIQRLAGWVLSHEKSAQDA